MFRFQFITVEDSVFRGRAYIVRIKHSVTNNYFLKIRTCGGV